jgi:heme exporter protein A
MNALLTGVNLKKVFNRRTIFQGINVHVRGGETLLVTGKNGSGKSTLVKILCGLLTPSEGSVELTVGGISAGENRRDHLGMVAPYLHLYDEFSADENLRFAVTARGLDGDEKRMAALLDRVGLALRRRDPVRTYSSGMKQRLKYAFALVHRPVVLVLDEPMANLDAEGVQMVHGIMEEHRKHGLLVVATNDLADADRHDRRVDLDATPSR